MIQVKKRDGKIVSFNIDKIRKVIEQANKAVQNTENKLSETTILNVLQYIEAQLFLNKISEKMENENINNDILIEAAHLQEIIEKALVIYNCNEVLQIYHDCCKEREKERFKRLEITEKINQKLSGTNIENQNANVDEKSFGGRIGETDSALLKDWHWIIIYHLKFRNIIKIMKYISMT